MKSSFVVSMARACRVVLNCVGLYRFSGRQVVNACLEAGTHCVDLSSEREYLESVQLECDEEAKKKNVYIVGSCGFGCLPREMGVVHLIKNFGGDVNSVEEYIETENKGTKPTSMHFATWASMIHGIKYAKNLRPIREKLNRIQPFPPKPRHVLEQRSLIHFNDIVKAWCLPFPGADRDVITRSQNILFRLQNHRPVQVHAYVKVGSLLSSILLMVAAVIFRVLIHLPFNIGLWLLLKFPRAMSLGYVTHEGQPRDEMDKLEFTIYLLGKGWSEKLAEPTDQHVKEPNKSKIVKVHGVNPEYGATCVCLLQSALTILRESDKMPLEGGVYPPGAAFFNTGLVERLQDNGITFEVL